MKNFYSLMLFALALPFCLVGQVGIGTMDPHQSAMLHVDSTTQGFLPPRMDQSEIDALSMNSPAEGLIVYNTDAKCLVINIGTSAVPVWRCFDMSTPIVGTPAAVVTSLDNCASPNISGTIQQGVSTAGTSFTIDYSGGNGGAYPGESLASSTGELTAVLDPGTLMSGAGSVTYNLSGTPTSTTANEFTINLGGQTCMVSISVAAPAPMITSLDNCTSPTITGLIEENMSTTGSSFSIDYTGGNGGAYTGETVTSNTGELTAVLDPGTLMTSTGSLTYNLSGTPTSTTANDFTINLGGQTCTVTIAVSAAPIIIPTTIVLAEDRAHFVASVLDNNYLPFTPQMTAANTGSSDPDADSSEANLNILGTIPTAGVDVRIPVTTTGTGSLPAFTQTQTVPANLTNNNVAGDVTLSWGMQAYDATTTFITATLTAVTADIPVKQLDLNEGLGADNLGMVLANYTYPFNNNGDMTSFALRVVPGVPDRRFGDGSSHDFLYLPVMSDAGQVWLNNNLGAGYSDITNPSFDPSQQAATSGDTESFGSLYQWGRYSDGHEFRTSTESSSSGSSQRSDTFRVSGTNEDRFIRGTSSWFDGNNPGDMWQADTGTNNPCPIGYRVPSRPEMEAELILMTPQDRYGGLSSSLVLPWAGQRRNLNASLLNDGTYSYYWTSEATSATRANYLYLEDDVSQSEFRANIHAVGASVRCILE